ncbi:MAG: hypothetical protein Kow0042_00630 [Calditrichia bacterium]
MKYFLFGLTIILFWMGTVFGLDDIIFFSDSPDSTFYDPSWGYVTGTSFLELAGVSHDKFPVDTRHPYQGAHSLRLHWISAPGGDWGIAVASIGWPGHDLTQYDSIEYWINAPQAILQADLPDLVLEDLSNNKSTRVWMGDYFNGVDSDSLTWQKVSVPINAFQPGSQNCDFTRIKTIFHFQKDADNQEHLAWIDEIRATQAGGTGPGLPGIPQNLFAAGHDGRIDLRWKANTDSNTVGYFIYRSDVENGPYAKLNLTPHEVHLYSDFFGQNNLTYYYYVTGVNQNYDESEPSDTVSATSFAMSEDQLLTSVQEAMFRYFYDYGHPVSGMARERKSSGDVCATGGTGFGLMALMIGAERGFAGRELIAARVVKILRFLQDSCTTYHGAWSHWINGRTGETIPFSTYDDGGDLVETAYLAQGLLTIRQYFTHNNPAENEIRQRATQMWEGIEWDWYRRTSSSNVLYWHWSPNHGWAMNMPVVGFNEAQIVYLLAVASPTHGVPASLYHNGWAGSPGYINGNTFYGYMQWVGPNYGGPLFFTHYSYLGFDPRNKYDQYCNYFDNNRNISLIHRAYCIDNPLGHVGYDSLVWGLTASDEPGGYSAHAPYSNDNGTITPTAAISAMPYTPDESIATLKHYYYVLGPQLWGEFGFKDAFHLGQNWFAQSYIAIDQGPMIIMIENYRTQLCWNKFMSNPEIPAMLNSIGFVVDIRDQKEVVPDQFHLYQNFPNPFNAETLIRFTLPKALDVTLSVYNVIGQEVLSIYSDKKLNAGLHEVRVKGEQLPSGIYYYRLRAKDHGQTHKVASRKMVLIK